MNVKKKMGRPPEDTSPVMVRMSNEMIKAIDALREKAPDRPSRPEIIRRAMATYLENLQKG